jgi:hypothetical protein
VIDLRAGERRQPLNVEQIFDREWNAGKRTQPPAGAAQRRAPTRAKTRAAR